MKQRILYLLSLICSSTLMAALPISGSQTSTYDSLGLNDTDPIPNGTVIDDLSYNNFLYNGFNGETGFYPQNGSLTTDITTTGCKIFTSDGSEFNLTSIDYSADNGNGASTITVTIAGYRDGALVGSVSDTFTTAFLGPYTTWDLSSLANIDEIRIAADDNFIFLDNLVVTTAAPPNNSPTISINNTNLNYTEGDTATQIDSTASASDSDGDSDWNGGTLTVQITANAEAADEISIPDNIVGSINTSAFGILNGATTIGTLSAPEGTVTNNTTLTITFNANATNALVQQVLRAIHYRNTSSTPGLSNRTVTFTVTDKNAGTANDTRTIAISPIDSDASVTASATVTEPVALSSTIDTVGEAVNLFDFTISDGGTADSLATNISQIVVNVTGTTTDTTRNQITWRLNGPDVSNVTGVYNAGVDTITFSSLSISVANGANEVYTVNGYYNDNTSLTDNQTIILSLDGDTDFTVSASGTQMGTTSAVTNSTGTTTSIIATALVYTTQPAPLTLTDGVELTLTTNPVLEARDAFGNLDTDFTETITLTENGAGTATYVNNSIAASAGVGTLSGMKVTYTAAAAPETFTLQANATGVTGVNSSNISVLAANNAPVNSVTPSITGTAQYNSTLSAADGTWGDSDGTIAGYTYQWQQDISGTPTNLSGATSNTYQIEKGLVGKTLRVAVTATDDDGASTTAYSSWTSAVTAINLTVTNTSVTAKVYDGNTTATLTGATLNGVIGMDDVTLGNATSGTFDTKDIGTSKTVTSAMTLAGVDAGNYSVSQPTLSGDITAKELTVTGTAVTTKTYDGNTTATLTGATLNGVVGMEDVTLANATSGTFDTKDIGNNKTVTPAMTLSGTETGNYTLTQPTLTGEITAKELTVTGTAVTTKTYDGNTTATLTGATLNGVVGMEDVTLGNATTGTFDDKTVANNKTVTSAMTLSGTETGNYTLTQPTLTGEITVLGLTVTNTAVTAKAYDGNTTATLTGATLNGVIGMDDVTLANATSGTFDNKDIGTSKTVTSAMTLAGVDAGNYTVSQPTLSGDITAKELTVTGTAVTTKTYDGNTTATLTGATLNGVVGMEDVILANATSGTFDSKDIGNNKTVTPAMTLSGTETGNYTLTQPTLTGEITAKELTVTGTAVTTKTYDGNTTATLTGATLNGVVGMEDVTLANATSGTFDTKDVGTNKTVTSAMTLSGTETGNYTLTQPTLTGEITTKALTITADDQSRHYTEANPTLTVSYNGFVTGEDQNDLTIQPQLATTATVGSTPGTYPITFQTSAISSNYAITETPGTLTVTNVAPQLTAVPWTAQVAEDAALNTTVGSAFTATDSDTQLAGASETLTFSLTDASGIFSINGTSGQLRVANLANLDYESYQNGVSITVTITDASGATDSDNFTVTLVDVNEAPVLTAAAPTLTGITEDDITNTGSTIANLLGNSLTDVDNNSVEGIAISAYDSGNGSWQYLNSQQQWTDLPVLNGQGFLLTADHSLRFVPNEENGTTATLTYYGWDQEDGTAETLVDVATRGNYTAFSTASDLATITVTDVNDAPTGTNLTQSLQVLPGQTVELLDIVLTDVDTNESLTVTFTTETPALGTLSESGNALRAPTSVWQATGTITELNTRLATLQFTPAVGQAGQILYTVTIEDGLEDQVTALTGQVTIALSYFTDAALYGETTDQFLSELTTAGAQNIIEANLERYRTEFIKATNLPYIQYNLELIQQIIDQVNANTGETTAIATVYNGWNVISCPFAGWSPKDTIVSSNISGLMYRYEKGSYAIQELSEPMTPGLGYWIYIQGLAAGEGLDFVMIGETPSDQSIPIVNGWNLIGPIAENTSLAAYDWIEDYPYEWDPQTQTYVTATALTWGKGYWGYIDNSRQYVDATFSTGNFDISLTNQTISTTLTGTYDYLNVYVYDETNGAVVFPMQRVEAASGNLSITVDGLSPETAYFIRVVPVTNLASGKAVDSRIITDAVDSTVQGLSDDNLNNATTSWTGSAITFTGYTGNLEWKAVQRNGSTLISEGSGYVSNSNQIDTGFTLNSGDYMVISVRTVDAQLKPTSVWKTYSSK